MLLSISCIAITSCEKEYTSACYDINDRENEYYHTVKASDRDETEINCSGITLTGLAACYIKWVKHSVYNQIANQLRRELITNP